MGTIELMPAGNSGHIPRGPGYRSSILLLRQQVFSVQGNLQNPDAPYSSIDYASKSIPSLAPQSSTVCNADLPTSSTVDRYIYVIEHYISQVASSPLTPLLEDACRCWKSLEHT